MTIPARPARTDLIDTVIRDTGIDGAMINHLVATFYDRVRRDPILGPIFEARVSDWDVHLGAMSRFWASVVLMSGTYHGEPMRRHLPLPIGGSNCSGTRHAPSARSRRQQCSLTVPNGSPEALKWALAFPAASCCGRESGYPARPATDVDLTETLNAGLVQGQERQSFRGIGLQHRVRAALGIV
jgi:hypothetical protein